MLKVTAPQGGRSKGPLSLPVGELPSLQVRSQPLLCSTIEIVLFSQSSLASLTYCGPCHHPPLDKKMDHGNIKTQSLLCLRQDE